MRSIAAIFRSAAVLNAAGVHVGGSDKMSNHLFGDAYESIFAGQRESVKTMLEVGVAEGYSLVAWQEVFPNAKIVGMDIHPAQKAGGIECHIADQRSQADCTRVANGRQFDVIVDDAFHALDHTLMTLFWLWPSLLPGGVYIIEDFVNIGDCRANITALFPNAEIVDTLGPFGGVEPLIVLRK